jgi:hypothetical protein
MQTENDSAQTDSYKALGLDRDELMGNMGRIATSAGFGRLRKEFPNAFDRAIDLTIGRLAATNAQGKLPRGDVNIADLVGTGVLSDGVDSGVKGLAASPRHLVTRGLLVEMSPADGFTLAATPGIGTIGSLQLFTTAVAAMMTDGFAAVPVGADALRSGFARSDKPAQAPARS